MKKKALLLLLLMALSIATPMILTRTTNAEPIPSVSPAGYPTSVQWATGGQAVNASLWTVPEYLMLYVPESSTPIVTCTTITIQGKDATGAAIEASVTLDGSTSPGVYNSFYQSYYLFVDPDSGCPVAFSSVTSIFQQNGSEGNQFQIWTAPHGMPEFAAPWPQYLGQYGAATGWQPGIDYPTYKTGPYLYSAGPGLGIVLVSPFQIEPTPAAPLQVLINWNDKALANSGDHDLIPETGEYGNATASDTLYITGLNQKGNPQTASVSISVGNWDDLVTAPGAWSTVCNVWDTSSSPNTFYIFTAPQPSAELFSYTLLIDHLVIHPTAYDILANPYVPAGMTCVYVSLADQDGNLIHEAYTPWNTGTYIDVNFATTAGTVTPSCNVWIPQGGYYNYTLLCADTNPRTFNVTAFAIVPTLKLASGEVVRPALELFVWTEMVEDGVNSVFSYNGWPLTPLTWGYTTWASDPSTGAYDITIACFTGCDPPQPYLPPPVGPEPTGIKLNGPIYEVHIPLYTGCNLISTPVSLILDNLTYSNYPTTSYLTGIPMYLLFGKTGAGCIEAVWWYVDGNWNVYVPGVTAPSNTSLFQDGLGYWIKAEKPCTLELSGVWLENGPFTPPTYELYAQSWNLIGVTTTTGISIADYLASTASGFTSGACAGPVWVYYAYMNAWVRNPSWGLYPGEAFWVYNSAVCPVYIAP
ncbi:MAG TPA: hypothetical protein VK487_10130 [Candidatus Bathyarchaeia archaeon]|nr:hypothetical protein [Candidatus Bathyarchaeia archaeon]